MARKRRIITLAKGDELVVNGYIIRAIGLDDKHPTQLQISSRNLNHIIDAKRDRRNNIYAGYADDMLLSTYGTLCIGRIGDLADSPRAGDNAAMAQAYLAVLAHV